MSVRDPGFQALTLKANGGPLRRVLSDVRVFAPAHSETLPVFRDTRALWDTGASRSVISSTLAVELGLSPVGVATVKHAAGESDSPTFLVNIGLPNGVGIKGIIVTQFPPEAGSFGFIIGMDVITLGDLSITNFGGTTWFSFRMPSVKHVDFVREHSDALFAGVSRNAPCPCGSMKKFKTCHGA